MEDSKTLSSKHSVQKNVDTDKPSLASVGQGMARKQYCAKQHLQCTGYLILWPQ